MDPDKRREANRKSQAKSRERRRGDPGGREVTISHMIPTTDRVRLLRLARHWGTLQASALAQALRLTEQQVVAGMGDAAKSTYFADLEIT